MQYKELQIKMASIYENQDQSLFGRVKAEGLPEDFENVDTKEKALAKTVVKMNRYIKTKDTKRINATRASKSPLGLRKFFFQVSSGERPCHTFLQKASSPPQIYQQLLFLR